jgi:hypothetical protein
MKQHVMTVGLVAALGGLSSLAAADPGSTPAPEQLRSRPAYLLSSEQMDQVQAGRINLCEPDMCPTKPPVDPHGGGGCNQCPPIWNSGVDGPIIIWDRSGGQ